MSGLTADQLREEFDRTFAEALPGPLAPRVDLLIARAGGESYALKVTDLAGLYVDRVITPIPSPATELLGLAALRGALVPVYALASLLGHPASGAIPRWIALLGSRPAFAVAFDHFQAHARVEQARLAASAPGSDSSQSGEAVEIDGVRIPIIDRARLSAG